MDGVARKLLVEEPVPVEAVKPAVVAGGEAGTATMSEAERKKAAIRAALAAGVYEDDGDVCINCSA